MKLNVCVACANESTVNALSVTFLMNASISVVIDLFNCCINESIVTLIDLVSSRKESTLNVLSVCVLTNASTFSFPKVCFL